MLQGRMPGSSSVPTSAAEHFLHLTYPFAGSTSHVAQQSFFWGCVGGGAGSEKSVFKIETQCQFVFREEE